MEPGRGDQEQGDGDGWLPLLYWQQWSLAVVTRSSMATAVKLVVDDYAAMEPGRGDQEQLV